MQEAFAKGMDLREYARQIESELDEIEEAHELDCKCFCEKLLMETEAVRRQSI